LLRSIVHHFPPPFPLHLLEFQGHLVRLRSPIVQSFFVLTDSRKSGEIPDTPPTQIKFLKREARRLDTGSSGFPLACFLFDFPFACEHFSAGVELRGFLPAGAFKFGRKKLPSHNTVPYRTFLSCSPRHEDWYSPMLTDVTKKKACCRKFITTRK